MPSTTDTGTAHPPANEGSSTASAISSSDASRHSLATELFSVRALGAPSCQRKPSSVWGANTSSTAGAEHANTASTEMPNDSASIPFCVRACNAPCVGHDARAVVRCVQ
eukprot:3713114-Rhodomonas_salina.5